MNIQFNIYVILTFAIIAQGIFAASLLSFAKENKLANRFLGLLLLAFSLWLLDTFFKLAGVYQQNPDFYFLPIFYSFSFGPLIYFYAKSITNNAFKFGRNDLLHFIPVLVQAALYIFLTLQNYEYKRWFWLEVHMPITYDIEFDLTLLSMTIYLVLAVRMLMRYQKWLENHFSEYSKIQLNWLKIILSVLLVLCVFWGIDFITRDFLGKYPMYNYSEMSLGLVVVLLAYGGIRQSNMVNVNFKEEAQKPPIKTIDDQILIRIKDQMQSKEAFLNPTLTLQDFAATLNLPARTVSEHINHGLEISFVDFVNQYRITCFKEKINAGQLKEFTILALAYESGFNSKSTFNRVFKKATGESPSLYVKRSQNKI